MSVENQWKSVYALLLNPDTREIFARLLTGETLEAVLSDYSSSKTKRYKAVFLKSGIINSQTGLFSEAAVQNALAVSSKPKAQGFEAFYKNGKIIKYPVSHERRAAMLTEIAYKILKPGENITEPEINIRLKNYTDEHAILRRYLVDYRIIERENDGSSYRLAVAPLAAQ